MIQKISYKQRLSILLGIILLLLLISNWEGGNTPIPGLSSGANAKRPIEYYLVGVTTHQYTTEGRLDYQMQAKRIEHLPPNDVTAVEQPRMVYFNEDSRWHAQAAKGLFVLGGEQISLETDVLLYEDQRTLRIDTEFLMLRPADSVALTGARVNLQSPEGQTTGVGMHVNLNDGYIKLLSEVESSFVRQ